MKSGWRFVGGETTAHCEGFYMSKLMRNSLVILCVLPLLIAEDGKDKNEELIGYSIILSGIYSCIPNIFKYVNAFITRARILFLFPWYNFY
jgi:hypothetical protein